MAPPQHLPRRRRARAARGMAIASIMLVLLGIMTVVLIGLSAQVGGGALGAANNALQMAGSRARSAAAFAQAEAGVEMTLQWLHSQAAPPSQTAAFAPASLWGATVSGSPARAVVCYPDPQDSSRNFSVRIFPAAGNAGSAQKAYLIESLGTSGASTQVVRAYVQVVSFAKYNYFSDQSSPDATWISGTTAFDGPVHCNNADGVLNNILWKKPAPAPIFSDPAVDAVTISGAGANWFLNTPANPTGPQTAGDWLSLAAGGMASVHFGAPQIAFPDPVQVNTDRRGFALAGTTAPAGATSGVTVPSTGGGGSVVNLVTGLLSLNGGTATGGIYVHGSVQEMTLGVGVTNTQSLTIQQQDGLGSFTTTILISGTLNLTTVTSTRSALPTVYTGATNGLIYCDGDIGSQTAPKSGGLHGTIVDDQVLGQLLPSNRLTIMTDPSRNINIDGSIRYNILTALPLTQPLNTLLSQNAGTLGLISNRIEVVDTDFTPFHLPLTNVEVDAAILAFDTCDATDAATRPTGTFRHVGSFIVKHGGSFGKFDSNGTLTSGFSTDRHYDARLVTNPPPYFPTANNQYDVLSWQAAATPLP